MWVMDVYSDNSLRFFRHDASNVVLNAMRILENGNVGIGTATPTESLETTGNVRSVKYRGVPQTGLSAPTTASGASVGTLTANDFCTANAGGTQVVCTTAAIPVASISATGTPSSSTYLRGDGQWATPSCGSVGWDGELCSDVEQRQRPYQQRDLPNGGNVGIGTTTPGATLDVAGNILTSGQSTGEAALELGQNRTGIGYALIDLHGDTTYSDYGLRLIRNNTGANADSQLVNRGTGTLYVTAADAGNVVVQTNSLNRLAVTSSGNVGIGTTSLGRLTGYIFFANRLDRRYRPTQYKFRTTFFNIEQK